MGFSRHQDFQLALRLLPSRKIGLTPSVVEDARIAAIVKIEGAGLAVLIQVGAADTKYASINHSWTEVTPGLKDLHTQRVTGGIAIGREGRCCYQQVNDQRAATAEEGTTHRTTSSRLCSQSPERKFESILSLSPPAAVTMLRFSVECSSRSPRRTPLIDSIG